MSLEARISQDLKAAMLAGQKQRVMTLRGLKSTLLYAKVEAKSDRDKTLPDDQIITILAREAKKRQESADMYMQGSNQDKADAELIEKAIIEEYLPEQLSSDELKQIVESTIAELNVTTAAQMGQVIGKIKQQAGPAADGALIAQLVKERLN